MKGIAPVGVRVLVPASPRLSSGGDGAPHAASADVPRLDVAVRAEDGAWAARTEALQAEAQAALRIAFHSPPTWQVG